MACLLTGAVLIVLAAVSIITIPRIRYRMFKLLSVKVTTAGGDGVIKFLADDETALPFLFYL